MPPSMASLPYLVLLPHNLLLDALALCHITDGVEWGVLGHQRGAGAGNFSPKGGTSQQAPAWIDVQTRDVNTSRHGLRGCWHN